jgi:carbon storage regulator
MKIPFVRDVESIKVVIGIEMLVLSRKVGERIRIGESVVITVVRVTGGGVRLGIEAPAELPVVREELHQALLEEDKAEQNSAPDVPAPVEQPTDTESR